MNDIAVHGGARAVQRSQQHDAGRHSARTNARDSREERDARIDAANLQWRDAWRTAEQRDWSVSPSRSMRCEDGASDCGRATLAPPIVRFLARERRGLPGAHRTGPPIGTTASPSDVVSRAMPRELLFQATYSVADVFRALSDCKAPFAHASQIAEDLYTIAERPRYSAEVRSMLRAVSMMVDQLAEIANQVFVIQRFCSVFGLVADLLEGQPTTPNDIWDVNMLTRSIVFLKPARLPLYFNAIDLGDRIKLSPVVPGTAGESEPGVQCVTPRADVVASRSDAVLPVGDERPVSTLDLIYSAPGNRPPSDPVVETRVGDREVRIRGDMSLEDAFAAATGPGIREVRVRGDMSVEDAYAIATDPGIREVRVRGDMSVEDAYAFATDPGIREARVRGDIPLEAAIDALPPVSPTAGKALEAQEEDVQTLSPDPEPALSRSLSPEDAAMRRISASVGPPRVQWTKVQSVPVRRRRGLPPYWARFQAAEYVVGSVDARGIDEGALFLDGGRTYVALAGRAVAVRNLLPGHWWIVDNHAYRQAAGSVGDRLPPVPLRAMRRGISGERFEIDDPQWVDVPAAYGAPVGDDGYIRYRGRKFIEIDGKRVETALRPIQGEYAIADFATPLSDVLPGADAMQIIRLADGSGWIEGEYGYYRLRFDLTLHEFYVIETADVAEGIVPRRALVDFDVERHRWTALVARGRSGYEDVLTAPYLRVQDVDAGADEARTLAAERSSSERTSEAGRPESVRTLPDEADVRGAGRASPLPSPLEGADIDDADARDDAPSFDMSTETPDDKERPREHYSPFPLPRSGMIGPEREIALFGHYANHLNRFPFFSSGNLAKRHRPRGRLRRGLGKTFEQLQHASLVAGNRMDASVRAALSPLVLSLRQRLSGLYPPADQWYRMTLQQKQQQLAQMVHVAYTESAAAMWPCLTGYCNEMADLVLSNLISKEPKLRNHLIQVALYDQKGMRGMHVMLAYSDQPSALDVFVARFSQDTRVQRTRPTFNEGEYCDWLSVNRDTVLLIDAWATKKLVDLSNATTRTLVMHALRPNLLEAGFDLVGGLKFRAMAALPRRPPGAVRPRRDVDGARALTSAPATWKVLAEWAVTGVPPPGVSIGALRADLVAAADSVAENAPRQSLLRTFAREMAPRRGNDTEQEGMERRAVVIAGHAASVLRETATAPPVPPYQAAIPTGAAIARLQPYASIVAFGDDHSAIRQLGSHTYLWMPDGRYYAVREILPGRLFIVDPEEGPAGRSSLPPIPLERDGALWRVAEPRRRQGPGPEG